MAVESITGAVVAGARTVDLGRSIAGPGRGTVGPVLPIVARAAVGKIVVEAVGMIIESHRAVMSGRKTGRWIAERTDMKIVGPIAAGNYAA
jgi:hypothetical protein